MLVRKALALNIIDNVARCVIPCIDEMYPDDKAADKLNAKRNYLYERFTQLKKTIDTTVFDVEDNDESFLNMRSLYMEFFILNNYMLYILDKIFDKKDFVLDYVKKTIFYNSENKKLNITQVMCNRFKRDDVEDSGKSIVVGKRIKYELSYLRNVFDKEIYCPDGFDSYKQLLYKILDFIDGRFKQNVKTKYFANLEKTESIYDNKEEYIYFLESLITDYSKRTK